MIDLFFAPTPNGWKIAIFLEESGLDYRVVPINIGKGEQFKSEFLKISPNNRMPAIVDNGNPKKKISVFESGAILFYLAEKTGLFLPIDSSRRYDIMQWLFWQMSGLGPMTGQLGHFRNYVNKSKYAEDRYDNEYMRLLTVLDKQLEGKKYMCGEYSIADMATFPWVRPYRAMGHTLDRWPNVKRWNETMKQRPAVRRAIDIGKDTILRKEEMTDDVKEVLFTQNGSLL